MRVNLEQEEQTEIGFAPLIDCVFLLLVFFLVATSFKTEEELNKQIEIHVELPKAEASFDWDNAEAAPLIIAVDENGLLYFEGRQVSAKQLTQKLRHLYKTSSSRRIRIDGDKTTPYQNIVHVLDILQFEGYTNIGMHTLK